MVLVQDSDGGKSYGYTPSTAPYGYISSVGKKLSKTSWTNIHATGAPGAENLLEEIMAKNTHNLCKDIYQIWEPQK